jgi:spore coat protein H
MKRRNGMAVLARFAGLAAALALSACSAGQSAIGADEWDDYSHGDSTDPDYEVVFPQDDVNTITITIDPEIWGAMQDNMTALYGEFGTRSGGAGGGPGGRGGAPADGERPEGFEPPAQGEMPEGFEPPADGEVPEDFEPPAQGEMPEGVEQGQRPAGGAGGGGNMGMSMVENPDWVPVDIEFDGEVWSNVGMRFKGNSSLSGGWGGGTLKLPFKLDFDEFEDDYPEIENQRFYGFKQLSFSPNWNDDSFLHEKVAADLFREAGVPAAQTAFYAVYVDCGEGPVYFGLYTAVELVEDTVIETQFEDDGGNVYKPEGDAATFAAGTYNEDSFDKETNQDEADYSDVLALYEALNAETRTTDPETWRADLEAVFDVEGYMRWLAVNSVIRNWDTYGQMAHNYYLYNDPSTGQLTWIPWDNNQAMEGGGMGGGGRGGSIGGSLDQESVGENWPLIRYLMDDPEYHALYVSALQDFVDEVFVPDELADRLTALHEMIAPYVVGENGEVEGYTYLDLESAFEDSLPDLIAYVDERYTLAQDYLSSQ